MKYNLSPGVDLQTADYLTDPAMFREYERLRDASFRTESLFGQLKRSPKFRRRMLEFARLSIFLVIVVMGISTISYFGLWHNIHQLIVTAL